MMEIQCPAPDCQYKTPEMEAQLAMQLLMLHNANVHESANRQGCKPEAMKRPLATLDMTETAWRDFKSQWQRYKRSTGLTGQDITDQLISCCADPLRMIINSESGATLNSMSEDNILKAMKLMAVRKTNPMVYRNQLRDMKQDENELFSNFASRLKEAAIDCEFSVKCSKQGCGTTISYAEDMVRDQAVYGLSCSDTQARILAVGSTLLSLGEVITKAEAEEQAKLTQAKIMSPHQAGVSTRRATAYKAGVRGKQVDASLSCNYCGVTGHGKRPSKDVRKEKCTAWGKTCEFCRKKGHVQSVCQQRDKENTSSTSHDKPTVSSLLDADGPMFCTMTGIQGIKLTSSDRWELDHVEWRDECGWYTTRPKAMPKMQLDVEVMIDEQVALHPQSILKMTPKRTVVAHNWHCTPDTGAQVTVSGPALLTRLNVREADLIPVSQKVTTANNVQMTILGAIVFKLTSVSSGLSTLQLCYIAKECCGVYVSLNACKNLGIVHDTFPQPAARLNVAADASDISDSCKRVADNHNFPTAPCGCPVRALPPPIPMDLPFPPSDTVRLKQWILQRYAASAFNTCCTQPLPAMHGDPLVIVTKPGTTPSAIHVPAPVPIHYQTEVKKGLDRDVALGVLEKVPVNTPVEWLHRMVIAPKKDGSPRRTVDLQALNQASVRQTHHTASPYHTAASIPSGVMKTCLDAWNGYHSVQLDENSRKMTSIITPWGVYRYRTAPQGYLASGDAYTHRYDNIVRDFGDIAKCVDDVCLWGKSNEENFFKTCQYLDLCSKNGIVFNPQKFVFCQEEVDFLGFTVTLDSLKPAAQMLRSIQEFPTPSDIRGIRSFFGIVNQVSFAFSMTETMAPFRALLKPSTPFYWDDALQKLFNNAKTEIVEQIQNGVRMFEKSRVTCLATDWSKTGIGYFLSQKHCQCSDITPTCCPDGWKLILAGSRFTKPAESRYHPVEGEALAVAYALHKTRYYIQGCKKLIIATDHRPLLKIFGDRHLEDISNPRLLNFKEKALPYRFQMIHVPGRKHGGPDSMSRHPVDALQTEPDDSFLSVIRVVDYETDSLDPARTAVMAAVKQIQAVSIERVEHETARDPTLQILIHVIQNGFPVPKDSCPDEVKEYFRYREDLSVCDGLILFKSRVLVPRSLRREVLECLHSAHQGVQGMKSRAAESVFWPGISAAIHDVRARCRTCNTIAPSQPAEPPITADPPQFPYEQVCADFFELGGIQYLAMADRYSGWLSVKCFPQGGATASALVSTLRQWFMIFGAPRELATDGATTFMSESTQQFLKTWGIRHRVSSVAFPHSNCRAEVAVKTAKRLIRDNVGPQGSLDTDRFARALMQYRNTPLQGINLSPAQILLGRNIRDFFPFTNAKSRMREEWLISADERDKALSRRHATHVERLSLHAHELPALAIGESVLIQNQTGNHPGRWDRTGVVVDIGPGPRQYLVRTYGSGRVTLRNRKFLRTCKTVAEPPFHTPLTPQPTTKYQHSSEEPDSTLTDDPAIQSSTLPHDDDLKIPESTSDAAPQQQIIQPQPAPSEAPRSTASEASQIPQAPRRSTRISTPPIRYGDYVTH